MVLFMKGVSTMKKLFILSSLLFLVGCSYDEKTFENLTEDGEIAKAYLEEQGYEVVRYDVINKKMS